MIRKVGSIALVAALNYGCASNVQTVQKNHACHTNEDKPKEPEKPLAEKYRQLKEADEKITKEILAEKRKNWSLVWACIDSYRPCVAKTVFEHNRMTRGSEFDVCEKSDTNEEMHQCEEDILVQKGDYAKLVSYYEYSNACSLLVNECINTLNYIERHADALIPDEKKSMEELIDEVIKIKDVFPAFAAGYVKDICENIPQIASCIRDEEALQNAFVKRHYNEWEKCENKDHYRDCFRVMEDKYESEYKPVNECKGRCEYMRASCLDKAKDMIMGQ